MTMANQPPSTEIDNWGEPTDAAKQKDALIRELEQAVAFADDNRTFQIERAEKAEALIRELVAALAGASGGFLTGTTVSCNVEAAIAKAKAQGYGPTQTTDEHPYSRDKLGEDC
jgi:hypothetical protein